jgi:hypothetical protein
LISEGFSPHFSDSYALSERGQTASGCLSQPAGEEKKKNKTKKENMIKPVKKWFDVQVTAANAKVSETIDLEKTVVAIRGLLITSDRDDLIYFRGTQRVEINRDEIFPEGYESKLLMSGVNVSPKARFYDLGEMKPGNGTIKMDYQDTDDGRTVFTPYRVRLYIDCEIDEV